MSKSIKSLQETVNPTTIISQTLQISSPYLRRKKKFSLFHSNWHSGSLYTCRKCPRAKEQTSRDSPIPPEPTNSFQVSNPQPTCPALPVLPCKPHEGVAHSSLSLPVTDHSASLQCIIIRTQQGDTVKMIGTVHRVLWLQKVEMPLDCSCLSGCISQKGEAALEGTLSAGEPALGPLSLCTVCFTGFAITSHPNLWNS